MSQPDHQHPAHQHPAEYKNDRLHAFVSLQKDCRIELKVKTSSSLIKEAKAEAVKAVNKEAQLPGFRKGKAPDEIIRKKFPREIEKELHSKLANIAFQETQQLAKLAVLNRNAPVTFDLKNFSPEEAELLFSFETEPSVPSIDPKSFKKSPVTRPEVSEKQIDEAIRQMQFYFATWTPITDRPIQDKDTIIINLDTIEGETSHRVFNEVRFEVSKERMAEWMQRLVLGAKSGDVVEGMSEPDENASEEEKKEFLPKKVRLSILKAEEVQLPPLDDDFAKKVGAKDVEQMKQSVTSMLNSQADQKVREALGEQVNEFLVREYPFDLPRSLIKTEKEHRQRQLLENPNFKKQWEQMSADERETLESKLIKESTDAVRLFYLSRQVVNDAKIAISHQEVQNEAIATLRSQGAYQVPVDQIPKEVYALAVSKVMLAKAQDFVLSHAQETAVT